MHAFDNPGSFRGQSSKSAMEIMLNVDTSKPPDPGDNPSMMEEDSQLDNDATKKMNVHSISGDDPHSMA